MARFVFVWPLNLLGAYYADLHGDAPVAKRFDLAHIAEEQFGVDGFRSSLIFDFDTSLVPAGHITLSAAGRFNTGLIESERSCTMVMIEAVRNEHHLYTADYNYVALSEKRALFNAMRDVMFPCRDDHLRIVSDVEECRVGMVDVCQKVSAWIGNNHVGTEVQDIQALCEFHATWNEFAKILENGISHDRRVVDSIVLRNVPPSEQRHLDLSSPMPMVIDWEHSFVTLRTVYNAAIKKLGGVLTNLAVLTMRDGQFKATVDSSVQPGYFAGGVAPTRKAALAKLYYQVIKHVNVELGYSIIDWHHVPRQFQQCYIDRFDESMGLLEKCSREVYELFMETLPAFDNAVAELSSKLDLNDRTEPILAAVHECSVTAHASKHTVSSYWKALKARQVKRATLESNLAAGA